MNKKNNLEKLKTNTDWYVESYMEQDSTLSRKDAIKKAKKYIDENDMISLTKEEKQEIKQKEQEILEAPLRKAEEKVEEIIKDYMEDDPELSREDALKILEDYIEAWGKYPPTKAEISLKKFSQKAQGIAGLLFFLSPLILVGLHANDIIHITRVGWAIISLIFVGVFVGVISYSTGYDKGSHE